jgi:hypothetical protein
MECSTGVIDLVSLTQGIKIIALPRVLVPRHLQRIHDTANSIERADGGLQPIQFGIDKAHIKGRVMDYQLGASHKLHKLRCNLAKSRFASQKLLRDAVHFQGAGVDVPLRLDVLVIVAAGYAPVDELNASNFDNAMTLVNL